MIKSKLALEKATKKTTLQMIGLTRSSSQEVADGYGPSIQKNELLADAKNMSYNLEFIRDIIEPFTRLVEPPSDRSSRFPRLRGFTLCGIF